MILVLVAVAKNTKNVVDSNIASGKRSDGLATAPDAHGLNLLLLETVSGSLATVRQAKPDAQISTASDAWGDLSRIG